MISEATRNSLRGRKFQNFPMTIIPRYIYSDQCKLTLNLVPRPGRRRKEGLLPTDPLQLHHKNNRKFPDISVHGHTPTAILVYHLCTHLWLFALAAVGEHYFLSLCLLVTQSQNKQYPRIIFTWNYSTYRLQVSNPLRKSS